MSTAALVEELERKIVVLQHDLRQSRINFKSENTMLKNRVRKYEDAFKRINKVLDIEYGAEACIRIREIIRGVWR